MIIRTLKRDTIIIFIFDIDKGPGKLFDNIKLLKKLGMNNIICLMQNKNFEDEIVKSSNLHTINNMYNTKEKSEFKYRFINDKNLFNKLKYYEFDINKMWKSTSIPDFSFIKSYVKSIVI